MKIKDLADGVTYNFRIRAKTLTYGPEVAANITTGPGEGLVALHLAPYLQFCNKSKAEVYNFCTTRTLFLYFVTQVLQGLRESRLSLVMAQPWLSTGPAVTLAVLPSHAMLSKQDHLVSER